MNLKLLFFTLVAIAFFQSCDDCKDIACFSPPPQFQYELLSMDSNENLLLNGTFETYKLKVIESQETDMRFELNDSLIVISNINEGPQEFQMLYDNQELFKIQVSLERVNEDCCSFTRTNQHDIVGTSSNFDSSRGVYSIYIN